MLLDWAILPARPGSTLLFSAWQAKGPVLLSLLRKYRHFYIILDFDSFCQCGQKRDAAWALSLRPHLPRPPLCGPAKHFYFTGRNFLWNKKLKALANARASSSFVTKLLTGIGPVTSTLPMWRSTDWATAACAVDPLRIEILPYNYKLVNRFFKFFYFFCHFFVRTIFKWSEYVKRP